MRARTPSAGTPASRPRVGSGRLSSGERLIAVGVLVSTFGVAVAMLPGAYNAFGPIKSLALLCGGACVALGFSLQPSLATGALGRAIVQRGVWPGLGLLGLACLATITSIDPSQSLVGHYPEYQGLLLLMSSALVALGAYSLAEKNALWRVLGLAAVVSLLAVATYAALQFAGMDPIAYERVFVIRRVRSTLGNGSNLGVFLCLALPLAIARAREERGVWRWAAWAALAAGAVTLSWSLSRGAWVGALAGTLAWLLAEGRSWDRPKRIRVATVSLALAIAGVALTAALVPNAAGRMGTTLDTSSGTAGWRTEVWSGASGLIAQRPLLGFGPASFRYAFPPRRTAAMQAGETGVQALDDPHNLFVSAGVSAGALAMVALAWLLGEALLAAWLPRRDEGPHSLAGPALAASLVGGVTALQFHFVTLDTAPLLAAIVALALARRAPHAASTPTRADTAARVAATALAAALALAAVLAGGLVLADRDLARGYSLMEAGLPWAEARARFAAATRLAPWEPAMGWALGRAATQALPDADGVALTDAARAMRSTSTALPLDPLVAAQHADVYLFAGLSRRDPAKLEEALPLIERSIALDPQNGYRWAARGTALAGLGRLDEAISALEQAVLFAPGDTAAWAALATLYEQTGQVEKAATARHRAATGQ